MCVTFHLKLFLVYICLARTDTRASIKCSIRVFIFTNAMFLLRIYANFPELNLKAPLLDDLEVEMKVSNITHVCVFMSFSVCIPVYIRMYVFLHAFMTHGCIDPCMLCALLI